MKYLALIVLFIVAAILLNRKKVKEVIQQIADGSKEKIDQANASAQKAVDQIADKGASILPVDLTGSVPAERIRRPVTPEYIPEPIETARITGVTSIRPIPEETSPIPSEVIPGGYSGMKKGFQFQEN